jgi:hypothetical protein
VIVLGLARHECATKICREEGIEYARRLLGHSNITATEVQCSEINSLARTLMRFPTICRVGCMLLIVGALRNRAAGQNLGSQSHDEQVKKQRAARLEIMRRHASSLAVKVENDGAFVEARIVDIPLLHYNNPAGETLDATVWAWGVRGRPVALASISQEMSLAAVEKWSCELVSLADKPVLLESNPGWRWASKTSGIEWKLAPDAPAVGETRSFAPGK